MTLFHRIATRLGLSNFTLDDVVREAQKKGVQDVTVTAFTRRYPETYDRHLPGEYQPVVIFGKRQMKLGNPIEVDFNPVEGIPGPMDFRHRVIEGCQHKAEQTLRGYVAALCALGANANYKDFDRAY